MNPALLSSAKDDWVTPQWIIDRVSTEHDLVLDIAAAKDTAKAEVYYDKEKNAFEQSWSRDIVRASIGARNPAGWLNPPYGRELRRWAKMAIEESRAVNIIMLVAARTDSVWFRNLAANGVVGFLPGRVRFERPDGTTLSAATFPSAIVWLGPGVIPHTRWLDWRSP